MINATLIGQMITFSIFVWVTMRFVWPPLHDALETRRAAIAEQMQEAEARKKAAMAHEQAMAQAVKEAQKERQKQREVDQQDRQALLQKAKAEGEAKKADIVASAQKDIEQARLQAQDALLEGLSAHVLSGVEKVLGDRMDATMNEAMIEHMLKEQAED